MASPTIPETKVDTEGGIRGRAAGAALAATVAMTSAKIFVGWLSGSAAVLSEGIHSFLDLVSAATSYFTVREAGKPADADHPFGHGKIETLSSLFESVLLVIAAGLMMLEGVDHLLHPEPLSYPGLAIGVIVFSMVVSFFMYRNNQQAAVSVQSSALELNALHFLTDVLAGLGVIAGLVIIRLTGWLWVDSAMAFAVAAYILVVSAGGLRKAMRELTDTQLPESEVARLRGILNSFRGKTIEAHGFRTRRSGATRHIDFHLVCCEKMTVHESHAVCDEIEEKIAGPFPGASVTIHVEPCEPEKTRCHDTCPLFKARQGLV